MTTVEVLAPVRLETRFVAPADRADGVAQWQLRLRVYPDEFSVARTVAPPSPAELDRLESAVASLTAVPRVDEPAAFAAFATSVGAARGLGLWRRCVVGGAVDRSSAVEPDHRVRVHGPVGLPPRLQVWLVHADGQRTLATTLELDPDAIGADLDLESFAGSAELAAGTLPETWWLSYERAKAVGLGADLDLGAEPPDLTALVVVGSSDTDAAELVDVHNAGSRLAVLGPGTPTNTVEGEPTTDLGDHAESLVPLLGLDPSTQQATRSVLSALTGRVAPDALPLIGGDVDLFGPGSLAVQGFWPVLWGRMLRDVVGIDAREPDLATWAERLLAPEGTRPTIRVGGQPYAVLPTSAYTAWVPDAADATADLEQAILAWATPWRASAAASAEQAHGWAEGADTEQLLGVLGQHAPSRHWRVRPVADAAVVAAERILAGGRALPVSPWDRGTADAWRGVPFPSAPIAPGARSGRLPGPPDDVLDKAESLKRLCTMHPEPLYFVGEPPYGLVGHLFRESLIAARAIVGEAIVRWASTGRVDLAVPQPLRDENTFRDHVMRGTDESVDELAATGDPDAERVAARFREVQEALIVIADLWEVDQDALFRATLAALDVASFRVDPWLTGVAERRLQSMVSAGAPFKLGAYGWVDAPAPHSGRRSLAPGPTEAGLLHAPSHEQALTAALLRDAALRHPDGLWQMDLDSAKVRASIALAERVRLGVHPYEALGLEVEAVAGDWDVVRLLRTTYPHGPDQDDRRSCDGAAVLAAARTGTLVAGLPVDLAVRLLPLDDVLDTYADLLVADGVHALVTGRADLANAAMEAASGLGAPPDLRAIRTPRAATTVRTAAWVVLPEGDQAPLAAPTAAVRVADPAYAALVTNELGAEALEATDEVAVASRRRLAAVLGGGDRDAPVPSLVGGTYPGVPDGADDALHAAMVLDLDARLARVTTLGGLARDAVAALDPDAVTTGDELTAYAARWHVDLGSADPDEPVAERQARLVTALTDRLAVPPPGPADRSDTAVNALRDAVRALAGDPSLPVLPVVDTVLLPTLRPAPELDRWLEVVAAVRTRVAPLEARQLDPVASPWPAALATSDGGTDPWHVGGPVLAVHGPAVDAVVARVGRVALASLDAWTDSVPGSRHVTAASFGFNAPRSRAPQAVLVAVPPDRAVRLDGEGLLQVVLETRELAHARAARPTDRDGLPWATPSPLVHAVPKLSFLEGWPP